VREFPPSGFAGMTTRFDLDKPVIAAVNGIAMGGGFELALACDLVIAAEGAFFALSEPRVGLAALAGGVQYLPRAIGLPRAMGILLTGRRVAAQEGFDLGFVTALAPAGGALEEARKWAAQMLECSPLALRATKQVARKTMLGDDFEQKLLAAREFPAAKRLRSSEDFVEGPRAFAEKRKPNWKNK
jgi:crotonobetainyl-CoA hydratase